LACTLIVLAVAQALAPTAAQAPSGDHGDGDSKTSSRGANLVNL